MAVSHDLLHKSQLQQAAFAPPFDPTGWARNALSVKNVYLVINEYLLHIYIEPCSFFQEINCIRFLWQRLALPVDHLVSAPCVTVHVALVRHRVVREHPRNVRYIYHNILYVNDDFLTTPPETN